MSSLFDTLILAGATRVVEAQAEASGPAALWEWIESHQGVVYPAVAVVIIGLIVMALATSFKADNMNAERKGQLKLQILQIMRRRVSGVSAATIATELQLDVGIAGTLLAELDEEGLIRASGAPGGNAPVQYRIRGVN